MYTRLLRLPAKRDVPIRKILSKKNGILCVNVAVVVAVGCSQVRTYIPSCQALRQKNGVFCIYCSIYVAVSKQPQLNILNKRVVTDNYGSFWKYRSMRVTTSRGLPI